MVRSWKGFMPPVSSSPFERYNRKKAILGLGSNLGERTENLLNGLRLISERCGELQSLSSIFETTPLTVPNVKQGPFYNLAVSISTSLSPETLMTTLLQIEKEIGRKRGEEIHWGPRVLDIDIITYEGFTSRHGSLSIPHPRYRERDFVLLPLKEIAPDFKDPTSLESVDSMLAQISGDERTAYKRIPLPAEFKSLCSSEMDEEEDGSSYSEAV